MTKSEAKRWACGQAYAILQSHMDSDSDFEIDRDERPADLKKIYQAMDDLVQEMFNRSDLCKRKPRP